MPMATSLSLAGPGAAPLRRVGTIAVAAAAVAAGSALLEAALIPGIAIGAAAVLAPGLFGRRLPRSLLSVLRPPPRSAPPPVRPAPAAAGALLPRLQVGRSLAKTVTFRVTVASLDFAWTYAVLGEVATAAGLSALSLAAGPVFYFLHEAAWNYRLPLAPLNATEPTVRAAGITLTRATAKTIAYEAFGAVAEFSVNLAVLGDAATAAVVTAPFVVLGPFVYYGHERAWESADARRARRRSRAARS